mgnify:CR=1 FL=1
MKQVYEYLINLLKDKDIVVVGVSGGPDSMALLYLLKEIRKKKDISLVCSHVNHNVRRASAKEKIFLEEWCHKNDILFAEKQQTLLKSVKKCYENVTIFNQNPVAALENLAGELIG